MGKLIVYVDPGLKVVPKPRKKRVMSKFEKKQRKEVAERRALLKESKRRSDLLKAMKMEGMNSKAKRSAYHEANLQFMLFLRETKALRKKWRNRQK